MANVLFNRDTLKVSGLNRPAYPFEVEVKNVDVNEKFSKEISYFEDIPKKDVDGNELYALPQEPTVTEIWKDVQIETTTNTGNPVMVTVLEKDPLLNEDGTQKEYEVTTLGETTEVTDEPVMEQQEDGTEVQKTDENGNLLYWGQVGTGQFIKCWTTVEKEVHKEDEHGQLLYWDTDQVAEEEVTENPPLEITQDDERYVEGLEKVLISEQKTKKVTFGEEQSEFTYDDIVTYKQEYIIKDTFYETAKLVEKMDKSLFSTDISSYNANLGFDFINLPKGGQVRTEKIALPKPASIIGILAETSVDGVEIRIGNTASDLQPLDKFKERDFGVDVSDVYIQFKNTTDKAIDIHSFAILV